MQIPFYQLSVYQPGHLPDFIALFSVYSRLPYFISLVSVYSPATRQTLWHWFQLTAMPLVRLYFIGFSLQT